MENKIKHIRLNKSNTNDWRTIEADFTNGKTYVIFIEGDGVRYWCLSDDRETRGPRRALDAVYSAFWLFFRDEEPGSIDYGTTIALDELVPFVDWSGYGKGTRAEKAAVLFDCLANYENF